MSALLFGSISSLADTSELQRSAFNEAFEAHSLDWHWDREQYRTLVTSNGGQERIAEYARTKGQDVDAAAVHATKSAIFQKSLATTDLSPRPGVLETLADAKADGWKVGLVTTTSPANVEALLSGLAPDVSSSSFDIVVDSSMVERTKPDPAAYTYATAQLGEQPGDCVAVEDNVGGVRSATAAGVTCVAFPNANTEGHDFGTARVVDHVSFSELSGSS